ncbi:hypothetical protein KAS08_00265 [Candidatus Pacearchaeota archaeon]|nr:hypothetical protein [Candidatus Pacearchaeota archaeon]
MATYKTFHCPKEFAKHFIGEPHKDSGFHFKKKTSDKRGVESAIAKVINKKLLITRMNPMPGERPELKEEEIFFTGDEIWRARVYLLNE